MIILGPTGAGKTTTLRCIAGLEHFEEGDIYIDEQRVNDLTPAERDVAFVFQEHILYPHLTAYENMAFPLRPRKLSRDEIDKRVRGVAAVLHIEHLLNRKPETLSGGETQRVGLGRAMVRNPRLFLMDEPLSNLDAKLRIEMRAWLKGQQRDLETTMLYVTHDQEEAMSMGDRVAVLNDGVLQQIGTPMDIYNHPVNMFVAGFVGNPSMNLLNCIVETRDSMYLTIAFSDVSIEVPHRIRKKIEENAAEHELTLGIRAEDIFVQHEKETGYMPAEVYVVEPLGPYNIIDLSVGEHPLTGKNIILKVRTPATFQARIGDTVWMRFDLSRIHVFDRKTEKAIG